MTLLLVAYLVGFACTFVIAGRYRWTWRIDVVSAIMLAVTWPIVLAAVSCYWVAIGAWNLARIGREPTPRNLYGRKDWN